MEATLCAFRQQGGVVDVPPLLFAMISGWMKPGEMPWESLEFQEAVGALAHPSR